MSHCGDGAGAKGKGDRDKREKEETEAERKTERKRGAILLSSLKDTTSIMSVPSSGPHLNIIISQRLPHPNIITLRVVMPSTRDSGELQNLIHSTWFSF